MPICSNGGTPYHLLREMSNTPSRFPHEHSYAQGGKRLSGRFSQRLTIDKGTRVARRSITKYPHGSSCLRFRRKLPSRGGGGDREQIQQI